MSGVTGVTEHVALELTHDGRNPSGDFRETSTYAQHSLEITRGQTGKTGWNIKMYFEQGKEAETLEAIKDLDAKLKAHFGAE